MNKTPKNHFLDPGAEASNVVGRSCLLEMIHIEPHLPPNSSHRSEREKSPIRESLTGDDFIGSYKSHSRNGSQCEISTYISSSFDKHSSGLSSIAQLSFIQELPAINGTPYFRLILTAIENATIETAFGRMLVATTSPMWRPTQTHSAVATETPPTNTQNEVKNINVALYPAPLT
ncbi:hypothetical protein BX600DRAFT_492505 [Xylariales sp. PMI_506]|nr:hypothetical protein BX600DRAFT_492505 [Xylariales sp. PMI_506]